MLASLLQNDSYGYQIIKTVGTYIDISESTLYPILKRLESRLYVRSYTMEHNGRLRKYYQITQDGKHHIGTFLCEWKQIEKIYEYVKEEYENE